MDDDGYICKDLDIISQKQNEYENLQIDFDIGTLFEEPLNKIFKRERFVETVRVDYQPIAGQITGVRRSRPDYKITHANYRSPYYKLFNMYGEGALEIKTHLSVDPRHYDYYNNKDRYALCCKMKGSRLRWGVVLSLHKNNVIREWSCVGKWGNSDIRI